MLNVHSFGPAAGAPVLVIHGVRNTGARYRRLAAEGMPGRRVLAVDLRGHGHSTWDPPWDAERHVDDLLATLDGLGVAAADVVAHSFGGLLALRLAARAPARVRSLALLDPAVGLPPGRCASLAEADLRGLGRSGAWESREAARAAWLEGRPPAGRWAADEDLRTFLARGEDGLWRFRFSRPAVVTAWSEMARPPSPLAPYAGPVLLVEALRDDYVSGGLRAMLRRDAGARLAERPLDAGHMLFWDAADDLAALMREWL